MKPSKYRNQRVEFDGLHFDSKAERDYYQGLLWREKAGEVRDIRLQPAFPIIVNGVKVATYKADFQFTECATGEDIVADKKSPITRKNPTYRLKKKLVEALYHIQVREV